MTLLLASQSATRQAMLTQAGVPFRTVAAPFDEAGAKARLMAEGHDAATLAMRLAQGKAASVTGAGDALVLGADSVLERDDGELLSKPRDREEAARQLRGLSGRRHLIHSAAVLVREGRVAWHGRESVTLTMREFSDAFLADYLEREWQEVRWNVGAYRIEGMGAQLFDCVEGSHFAILGLPLLPLLGVLRSHGIVTS